jgi:hypothetical protein
MQKKSSNEWICKKGRLINSYSYYTSSDTFPLIIAANFLSPSFGASETFLNQQAHSAINLRSIID